MDWRRVAREEEVPEGRALVVELEGEPVAIYRVGGRLYAIADTCPHQEWSLGREGELEGYVVTCGGHGWQFDVRTGRCIYPVIGTPVAAYDVKVEDGAIYLRPREG